MNSTVSYCGRDGKEVGKGIGKEDIPYVMASFVLLFLDLLETGTYVGTKAGKEDISYIIVSFVLFLSDLVYTGTKVGRKVGTGAGKEEVPYVPLFVLSWVMVLFCFSGTCYEEWEGWVRVNFQLSVACAFVPNMPFLAVEKWCNRNRGCDFPYMWCINV